MSVPLPDGLKAWLEQPIFVTMATINADGSPQLSVVWADHDGDDVIISTTTNRLKYRNMVRDPRITVSLFNPEMQYQYAEIRGTVKLENEGSMKTIDAYGKKYRGWDRYPADDGTDNVRVDVRLTPEKVLFRG